MATKQRTEQEQEAMDLIDTIYEFAEDNGWSLVKAGVNKQYAWAKFALKADCGQLQVFYAIEGSTAKEDKFIFGSDVIPLELVKPIILSDDLKQIGAVLLEAGIKTYKDLVNGTGEYADSVVPPTVPPTSAAHPDDVPPTEYVVPPTDEEDAAQEAAYAAHQQRLKEDRAAQAVIDKKRAELDDEDGQFIADQAKRHIAEADPDYSQQDVYNAVHDQVASEDTNWSPILSPLTTDEVLARVVGREVHWRNSFSGRVDSAVVANDREAKKHPAKITPKNFDIDKVGEDMRILHFLEPKGGFRAVAVGRIVKVG